MNVTERLQVAAAGRADGKRGWSQLCARDFLRDPANHECVRPYGIECSRTYDPGPPPDDEGLYVNTPLGVLWGLTDIDYETGKNPWHASLAGWTLTRGES